jgi:hypothetical protein
MELTLVAVVWLMIVIMAFCLMLFPVPRRTSLAILTLIIVAYFTAAYAIAHVYPASTLSRAMLTFTGTDVRCDNVRLQSDGNFLVLGPIKVDGVLFDRSLITPGKYDIRGKDLYEQIRLMCFVR